MEDSDPFIIISFCDISKIVVISRSSGGLMAWAFTLSGIIVFLNLSEQVSTHVGRLVIFQLDFNSSSK